MRVYVCTHVCVCKKTYIYLNLVCSSAICGINFLKNSENITCGSNDLRVSPLAVFNFSLLNACSLLIVGDKQDHYTKRMQKLLAEFPASSGPSKDVKESHFKF